MKFLQIQNIPLRVMPSSRPCGYSQIIKCLFKMNIDSWTLFPGIIIQLLSKGPNNRIFKVPPMIRVWKPPVFRIQTPVSCRWTPSYDIALCTGFHISPFTLLECEGHYQKSMSYRDAEKLYPDKHLTFFQGVAYVVEVLFMHPWQ